MKPRVVVAMSGGVDSSVAAALLAREGYEVIGVTLQVWPAGMRPAGRHVGCCSVEAVDDARRVADRIGIDHYVFDFQEAFGREVIRPFIAEYVRGRTPNPCIWCNERIKFGLLLAKALELGAQAVATGHYARVERSDESGRWLLKRARDARKDQTYALWPLTQDQLAASRFPLGPYTKEEVRRLARDFALPVAAKPESQEICFIPDNDYRRFLKEVAPEAVAPGPIVDVEGRTLGRHQGVAFYTVGQRKGLGVALGRPLYVLALDPESRTVVVGDREQACCAGLVASHCNFIAWPGLEGTRRVLARIRRSAEEVPADIEPCPQGAGPQAQPEAGGAQKVVCRFEQPQWAVTPGQSVVWYDGDVVVGGGVIGRAIRVGEPAAHTTLARA